MGSHSDRCKCIGILCGGKWETNLEKNRRVYDPEYLSPTLVANSGGNTEVKISVQCIGNVNPSGNGMNGNVFDSDGLSPTLTTNKGEGIKVTEPSALRMVRTEEGKKVRKAYENHEVHHGFNEFRTAEPREDGCSNAITTVQKDNYIAEPRLIGGVGEKNFGKQYRQGNRVYDSETIACALQSGPVGNMGGYSYLYAIKDEPLTEPHIGAIRGRNPDNPSDRTAGIPTQQRLEIGGTVSNTLTSVQKDNVVLEPNIRVRKLTPKECWRLMGFDDESFERAAKVNSNSQLYKQAGNSIVVNVLEAIFKEMID